MCFVLRRVVILVQASDISWEKMVTIIHVASLGRISNYTHFYDCVEIRNIGIFSCSLRMSSSKLLNYKLTKSKPSQNYLTLSDQRCRYALSGCYS